MKLTEREERILGDLSKATDEAVDCMWKMYNKEREAREVKYFWQRIEIKREEAEKLWPEKQEPIEDLVIKKFNIY